MGLTKVNSDGVSDDSIKNADIKSDAAIVTSKLSGAVTGITSHGLAASATTDTTNADNIGSGTLAAARVADLAASKITTGTIATARLGTGTAGSGNFLRGDGSWQPAAYDDSKLRMDLNVLALHTAVDNNKSAHNLNNTFIDNFQDDTGIATETNVDRTAGEYVASITTGSQTLIPHGTGTIIGDWTNDTGVAFDGNAHVHGTSAATKQGSHGSAWLGKDWGAGNEKKINGFKVFSTTNEGLHGSHLNTSGCTLKLYGHTSDDIGASTDLGGLTNQNFRTTTHTYTVLSGLNTDTAYRYHWMFFSIGSGTANWFYCSEVEFYENPVNVSATGTLISTAQTATDARTKVSGVILYEDKHGTATLGTDLKISFSCDNGSNWTALDATAGNYTAGNAFSTGIKTAHLKEVTCTSGTQIKYKAEWANQAASSKETRLHGIGMNY